MSTDTSRRVSLLFCVSVYVDAVQQAMQKAQQARGKTVKQEHSTAQAHSDAQHKHDLAVANERKAANDLSVRIVIVVNFAQAVLTIYESSCVVSPVCFLL